MNSEDLQEWQARIRSIENQLLELSQRYEEQSESLAACIIRCQRYEDANQAAMETMTIMRKRLQRYQEMKG